MPGHSFGPRTGVAIHRREVPPQVYDFIDGEVIEDRSIVVQLCSLIAAEGAPLVCSRCEAPDEPIAAIIIIESMESAWLACAGCWHRLPRARLID